MLIYSLRGYLVKIVIVIIVINEKRELSKAPIYNIY